MAKQKRPSSAPGGTPSQGENKQQAGETDQAAEDECSREPENGEVTTTEVEAEQSEPEQKESDAENKEPPQPEKESATEKKSSPNQKSADQDVAAMNEKYVRLLAEYDNYRKRSAKEREATWNEAKASTVKEFFAVYDNLERALNAPCSDDAYQKGVEMTMKSLKDILAKLGIEEIPALGEKFDPELHNAVMHVEDENAGENTIVDVFQPGFRTSDGKVIRFSVVKVAN